MSTIDQLIQLQKEQLELLRGQRQSTEIKLDSIDKQVREMHNESIIARNVADGRMSRIESNLDVAISQALHTSSLISGLDARTAEHGKRLSDVGHRIIQLESGVSGINAKTETIQQRCAAHEEKFAHVETVCEGILDRIETNEEYGKQEFKEVTGEIKLLQHDVSGRIMVVDGDAKVLRTKVDQTWKVIVVVAGSIVTAAGLIIALVKLLGSN
jgi:DNA repair exonuclease SbcCD ATPase subunit